MDFCLAFPGRRPWLSKTILMAATPSLILFYDGIQKHASIYDGREDPVTWIVIMFTFC